MGLTTRFLIALAVLVTAAPYLSPASLDALDRATRRPWLGPEGGVASTAFPTEPTVASSVETTHPGDHASASDAATEGSSSHGPITDDVARDASEDQTIDEAAAAILRRQELAARDLRAFTADVVYETRSGLLGDSVLRTGRVIYRNPLPGGGADRDKALAIRFDAIIENRRKRERTTEYVFAGRWLVEKDAEQKLFIKREVAPPGQTFDPFKLGEGPIPLPIGQPADEVLKRFAVTTTAAPTDGRLAKLAARGGVDGIRLIPRAGTKAAEDIARVDIFYDRMTNLPVGVIVVEPNEDVKIARLDDIKRNVELDAASLELLSVETPDEPGWTIDVRPLES